MHWLRYLTRALAGGGAAALLVCGALAVGTSGARAAGTPSSPTGSTSLTIPLNNDTADIGTDCPSDGATSYWHFVVSPNNGESAFITFHLNLGDAQTYDTSVFITNGDQWDNVFVAVPDGKQLDSLIKDKSSADISWSGEGTEPARFQLSHVCPDPPSGAQDLTVEKTAVPSYDLAYDWEVAKAASPMTQTVDTGQSATFGYTVTATHDGGTASAWAVAGTITVTNPNVDQDVVADVSDTLPGADCAIEGDGSDVTVPAGDSVNLPYACTLSSATAGTNTATVTWDADTYGTPSGSATATADFAFGDPTTITDECLAVTDTVAGDLGTACVGDTNPSTFTYQSTYTGPAAGSCADKPNTAAGTTNDTGATASDDATVQVCSYQARLTPGYWKTHLAYDPRNPGNPWVAKYLSQTLGTYAVDTTARATAVWNAMNCSNTGSNSTLNQNAIGCLAGHLLAAKLNVANGANPCIGTTITTADAFLLTVPYVGPSGNYSTIGTTKRTTAVSLKTALDAYNNGNGCT